MFASVQIDYAPISPIYLVIHALRHLPIEYICQDIDHFIARSNCEKSALRHIGAETIASFIVATSSNLPLQPKHPPPRQALSLKKQRTPALSSGFFEKKPRCAVH